MGVRNKCSKAKHEFAKKMRQNMTGGEKKLWKELCSKKIGVWCYPQSVMYGYVLDFWIPAGKIAIEVDGPHHKTQKAYDNKRDAVLKKKGIVTMRFTDKQVKTNTAACVALIRQKIKRRMK